VIAAAAVKQMGQQTVRTKPLVTPAVTLVMRQVTWVRLDVKQAVRLLVRSAGCVCSAGWPATSMLVPASPLPGAPVAEAS